MVKKWRKGLPKKPITVENVLLHWKNPLFPHTKGDEDWYESVKKKPKKKPS